MGGNYGLDVSERPLAPWVEKFSGKASWETVTWKTLYDGSCNACDQIPDARWPRLQHCAQGDADIVGSLVRILLNVTILAPRILRWLLDFLWIEVDQDLIK